MTIYDDLLAAGLPVIDAEPGQTPHFSRLLTLAEEDIRDSIMNKSVYRARTASKYLQEYPWARTTQQDWQAYFDSNLSDTQVDALVATITNIATAKTALATMWKRQNLILDRLAKVEIAMRDLMIRNDNF